MQCVFCNTEIDHLKKIHPKNEFEQREHAAALSTWEQITVHIWRGTGDHVIFQGHVCPNHKAEIDAGLIKLSIK